MTELGIVIHRIISIMHGYSSESMHTLRRIFSEQYEVIDETVTPRSKHEISASSVQSPHDTECHYRDKDGNKVKDYSINLTESCDSSDDLRLITNVIVDVASTSDCDFVQPAIEATQEIVTGKIETVNADGAYHSPDNQDYCKENEIYLIVSAIQGKPSRYALKPDGEEGLIVTDLTTDMVIPVRKVEPRKEGAESKWAIRTENRRYRYFTQKDIDTCLLRQEIAAISQTELNLRNNVEASIFQLGYHYPNDKSRYRGLIKHEMWANIRCLWVNFVRIVHFVARSGSKCVQKAENRGSFSGFYSVFAETYGIISQFVFQNRQICVYYEYSVCK